MPVVRIPVTSFKSRTAVTGGRLMGRYIRDHAIQLVHTFDTPLNVFGVPVAKAYRTPVVLSSQRAHRELSGRFRPLLRVSDRMADGVVVNCESVKRQLVARGRRCPPARIQICYNGIDTKVFHPDGRQRPGGALTIGVVCALRPEKGLRTLIEAFAIARQRHSCIRLQFVGSGPMLDELQKLAAELGVSNVVNFEPTASRVSEWLRRIDIFVLPSLSEALSNALMEAMACGCAVIASNIGGNPELVSDERTGLLFEPGDKESLAKKLAVLIENTEIRATLASQASSLICNNFSLRRARAAWKKSI